MDAFEQAVCKQSSMLLKYARTLCKDATMAEDLLQETLLRALERRHLYKPIPGKSIAAWLVTIMRNQYLSHKRGSGRMMFSDEVEAFVDERSQIFDSQENTLFLKQVSDIAEGALNPRQLELLRLAGIEGYSYPQITAILGIPEGTAKSRLFRARETLGAAMQSPVRTSGGGQKRRKLLSPPSLGNKHAVTLFGEVYQLTAKKTLRLPRRRRGTALIYTIV